MPNVTPADVGVATADWYPQLSLSGFLGYLSAPGLTLSSATESWSLAPTLSWQVADYPSLKARLQATEAGQAGALADFEQAVFDALAEMQLSLQRYRFSREQNLQTEMQWQANSKAVYIAQARYEAGSGEFLTLLDSERELLATRNQLAQLQQQSFNRLVDIYQSFAGAIVVR
ncbi:TolC family protein [Idiomarina xiamenensis]|uniref:TolC family protein n=1 Tax=Idiomarina xiamenensis TaxID=1207041 RepID=UPI001ED9A8DA|nr:TolC family protein [Idiomarina xiamenensis]